MSEQKMREALEFYADPIRYQGPNQRNETDKKWSGDAPYILDITRDGGRIAREALAQQPVEAVELTDEEIVEVAISTKSAEPGRDGYILPFTFARAIIAADRAKRGGV